MKKEQMTIRLKPLVKIVLTKKSQEEKFNNLNDFINDILEKYILKKEEESKVLEKVNHTNEEIENINLVLGKILEVMSNK
ncbi:hypothetical protein [Methylophilus methylotrophus]|uniref:hypothetical protein n=1 Tax=Methylophilus methylotrophus TaxID=17 RepID=UPI00037B695F|nr:hypothetical protein [Methylophilus methylotrophus]